MTGEEVEEIEDILFILQDRQLRHSHFYYAPLDARRSALVRAYYRSRLILPEGGDTRTLANDKGTRVAKGYLRVVVGDYGAYVEFSEDQAVKSSFGEVSSSRAWNKYVPLYTKDALRTKIYHQLETVKYADYVPGLYYVGASDVFFTAGGK